MKKQDVEFKQFDFPTYKRPFLMSAEMEEIHRHFMKIEEGQVKIHAEIDLMADSLRKVKESVTGDPSYGVKGIAERLEDVEDKVKAYDKIYYKAMGMALLIGVVWPLIVALILKFLTNYMAKS